MGLRKKITFVLLAVFLVLAVFLAAFNFFFLLDRYRHLEEEAVRRDVERAVNARQREISHLDTVARDWAYWDDTYLFMENRDPAYIQSNLVDSTFTDLRLNLFLLVDSSGNPVYSRAFDLETGRETDPPSDLDTHLATRSPLLSGDEAGEGTAGPLVLEKEPFIIAAEPVLTSEEEGPCRGTLIMGRYLDEAEIGYLAETLQLDLGFLPAGGSENLLPGEVGGNGIRTEPESSDILVGYTFLQDIYGEPVLILRVTEGRDIYRQGLQAVIFTAALSLGACLLLGLVVLALLEKTALSRISSLERGITEITEKEDFTLRLEESGRDEIASLARSLNSLLRKIQEQQRSIDALLNHSQDVVALLDERGVFSFINRSSEKTLGYEPRELIGKSVLDFIHPADRKGVEEAFGTPSGIPPFLRNRDLRFLHGDGHWIHLEAAGYNLLDDPAVGAVLIQAHDITERVKALERLEKINRLFLGLGEDLLENMESIVRFCREIMEGAVSAYGRLEKGVLSLLVVTPEKADLAFIRESRDYLCRRLLEEERREPLAVRDLAELPGALSDPLVAEHRLVSLAAAPVSRKGTLVGFLLLFDSKHRVFGQREMELMAMLSRALSVEEELLAKEQGLKDFIDIASHELRHPITLLKGYAHTLQRHGGRMREEEKSEFLDYIVQGSNRLDALIHELLDLSRIERGRFTPRRRKVVVRPLLQQAVEEMRMKNPEMVFRLTVNGSLGEKELDPDKFFRLLVILLDNAANYSPPGEEVEIRAEVENGFLAVSVLDRGRGIPEREKNLVFERFYQVEETLHHSRPGLGLGLYIAREIVEAHQGRIWYEPRPGGGSVFRFLLP
jgi:PAS domain S-box-containing protein